jgi:FtsH-binding integral membrane protein
VCWTYIVGGFVSYFEPAAVLCTSVSTLLMFLGLSVYAMLMSDEDMHILAGLLISLLVVFIPVIIFSFLFPNLFTFMIV